MDSKSSGAQSALDRYRAQLESIGDDREQLKRKDRQFGKVRVLLFFLALLFWLVGYGFDGVPPVAACIEIAEREDLHGTNLNNPANVCKHGTAKGHCPDCPDMAEVERNEREQAKRRPGTTGGTY